MEKRIVIDTSTGGLDYYPIEHGIEILRIKINIEGKEYEDGLTLKADKFYDMLKNDKELLPRTSQPSVGEVAELFQEYLNQGIEEIFVVTISSKMSGTYNSCILAAKEFEGKLKIKVFDTKTVCFSEGIFALEAKKMLDEGYSLDEIENIMYAKRQALPNIIVSLRIDQGTDMGMVTDIQQALRKAYCLRVNYSATLKI